MGEQEKKAAESIKGHLDRAKSTADEMRSKSRGAIPQPNIDPRLAATLQGLKDPQAQSILKTLFQNGQISAPAQAQHGGGQIVEAFSTLASVLANQLLRSNIEADFWRKKAEENEVLAKRWIEHEIRENERATLEEEIRELGRTMQATIRQFASQLVLIEENDKKAFELWISMFQQHVATDFGSAGDQEANRAPPATPA